MMLASDRHRVIAKMDLLEVAGGAVTPVDYKHGRPHETDLGIEIWPTGPRTVGRAGADPAGQRLPVR